MKEKRNRNIDLVIIIALVIAIALFFVFSGGVLFTKTGKGNMQDNKNAVIRNDTSKKDDKSAKSEQESETKDKQESESKKEDGTYKIGETWTVDGQWSLTVNSVEETPYRNEFSESNPAAVYIVTYTYTNLGRSGGLFMSMDNTIVDNSEKMGYSYPGEINLYAKETPVGATCQAQCCIGVDNPGSFEIYMDEYDDNGEEQKAIFSIEL